jgi:hypothetical protein
MATKKTQPFGCSKCERSFPSQGALNGHQRSHSFFSFLGKTMPREFREEEQEQARTRVMLAAIHHYTRNSATHCDVCEAVSETVDRPLMRDLVAYFASEDGGAIPAKAQSSPTTQPPNGR